MDITQLPNSDGKLWQPTEFQIGNDPWTKTQVYDDVDSFFKEYGDAISHPASLNFVIDFYFYNHKVGEQEYTSLNLVIFHQRQACVRGVIVLNIKVDDLRKIQQYLTRSKRLYNENFKWVPNIK